MQSSKTAIASRHLRDLFSNGTATGQTDGQLLTRYANCNDGSAFEALVMRHGPMVVATCRAVLKHEHDIEDAFQASFLVLARKAGSVRAEKALGGWLHRVAYRIAVQAKNESERRRRHELEAAAMTNARTTSPGPDVELYSVLHSEIERLPERERLPVVLVDLDGLSYEQAAGRLRWTVPVTLLPAGQGPSAAAREPDSARCDRPCGRRRDGLVDDTGHCRTSRCVGSRGRRAGDRRAGPGCGGRTERELHPGAVHDPTEDRAGGRRGTSRIRLCGSRGFGSGSEPGSDARAGHPSRRHRTGSHNQGASGRSESGPTEGRARLDDRVPRPRRRSCRQGCRGGDRADRLCGNQSGASSPFRRRKVGRMVDSRCECRLPSALSIPWPSATGRLP